MQTEKDLVEAGVSEHSKGLSTKDVKVDDRLVVFHFSSKLLKFVGLSNDVGYSEVKKGKSKVFKDLSDSISLSSGSKFIIHFLFILFSISSLCSYFLSSSNYIVVFLLSFVLVGLALAMFYGMFSIPALYFKTHNRIEAFRYSLVDFLFLREFDINLEVGKSILEQEKKVLIYLSWIESIVLSESAKDRDMRGGYGYSPRGRHKFSDYSVFCRWSSLTDDIDSIRRKFVSLKDSDDSGEDKDRIDMYLREQILSLSKSFIEKLDSLLCSGGGRYKDVVGDLLIEHSLKEKGLSDLSSEKSKQDLIKHTLESNELLLKMIAKDG